MAHTVDLLLENGASETVLDALGRAPPRLMPEGFASLNDDDTHTTSDDQPKLEQKRDVPLPFQSADSGCRVPDPGDKKFTFYADIDDLRKQSQSSGLFHGTSSHRAPLQRLIRQERGISTPVIPPQYLMITVEHFGNAALRSEPIVNREIRTSPTNNQMRNTAFEELFTYIWLLRSKVTGWGQ